MEMSSYKGPLEIKHIKQAAEEETKYVDDRRKGRIKSLATSWKKYNNVSMQGIEWYTMHAIAGLSGSGKTAILNQLETDLIDLNPNEDIEILSLNFEMMARALVGRKYSKEAKLTVQEIHSGKEGINLSDADFKRIQEAQKKIENYPIYYCDVTGTVEDIIRSIFEFARLNPKKGLVVMLDHTLLVEGKGSEMERTILVDLMKAFKKSMKYFKKKNKRIAYIILNQLNRNIEESDRLAEPGRQNFPAKRDIFGGDAVYQMCDLVMVSMNPYQMGLEYYGPKMWPTKGRLFWHFIKVREGEPCVALMVNKLAINTVEDYDSANFDLGNI
jgi:replicative DNA helicase